MPVYLNRGYTDIDTIVYTLPENIISLTEPINHNFTSEFGSYISSAKMEGNKLTYYRKLVLNEGTFKPESYNQFFKFINDVNGADNLKLILSLKK
ncbi:MAG: DUF3858 domain-containing protein [Pedobacter sp.]|nr:MAG: DUF3858 domain-containing protein [Pedobacter sp.]